MRILHINKRYGYIGGMELYTKDLVAWQRNNGHHADVLAINTNRKGRTLLDNDATIYLLPELFEYQGAVISHRFLDTLARLSRKYDLLHFQYPFPMAELSYLLISLFSRVPAIATFHGEVVPSKRLSSIYYGFARLFLSRMKRIVATSPAMAYTSRFLQHTNIKSKVTVIPLGIEPPPFQSIGIGNHYPPESYPKLLFVGRFARYKGIEYLIKALSDSPGHLILVGDGPSRPKLQTLAAKLRLGGRTTFVGSISDKEKFQLYQEADLLVLPSIDRGESFGYVTLEAMASSTALLTTELGTGTSFANVNGLTGMIVPPKDSNALAKAITLMARSNGKLAQYGEAARIRFDQEFHLEKMGAKQQAVYEEVC